MARTLYHGSGCSTLGDLYNMYIGIDGEVRFLLESCGLTALIETSEAMIASSGGQHVARALVEYFWDTTNTFHFPWGEMMVTRPTSVLLHD